MNLLEFPDEVLEHMLLFVQPTWLLLPVKLSCKHLHDIVSTIHRAAIPEHYGPYSNCSQPAAAIKHLQDGCHVQMGTRTLIPTKSGLPKRLLADMQRAVEESACDFEEMPYLQEFVMRYTPRSSPPILLDGGIGTLYHYKASINCEFCYSEQRGIYLQYTLSCSYDERDNVCDEWLEWTAYTRNRCDWHLPVDWHGQSKDAYLPCARCKSDMLNEHDIRCITQVCELWTKFLSCYGSYALTYKQAPTGLLYRRDQTKPHGLHF